MRVVDEAPDAVVFDFDGVLVESTDVKTRAFAAIYREWGEDISRKAVTYHLAQDGISRYVKFRYLHQALLGIQLTDEELRQLGNRFSDLVLEEVVAAPWVNGAREYLASASPTLALFVASGTPDDELKIILSRRGIAQLFRSAHGSPATKSDILKTIVKQHALEARRVLMVGDSTADLEGARSAGTRFLGVVRADNPFPPGVATVPDLRTLKEWL